MRLVFVGQLNEMEKSIWIYWSRNGGKSNTRHVQLEQDSSMKMGRTRQENNRGHQGYQKRLRSRSFFFSVVLKHRVRIVLAKCGSHYSCWRPLEGWGGVKKVRIISKVSLSTVCITSWKRAAPTWACNCANCSTIRTSFNYDNSLRTHFKMFFGLHNSA